MHESWISELMTMVSGWLVSYLTHSAVTLAILGAMAWLGDRMLRRVGPQARHRIWVGALLAGVALPLLPDGTLTRLFDHVSPDFDKNAMEAVRQYRFHPALRDGKPVAVAITIAVNFHNN